MGKKHAPKQRNKHAVSTPTKELSFPIRGAPVVDDAPESIDESSPSLSDASIVSEEELQNKCQILGTAGVSTPRSSSPEPTPILSVPSSSVPPRAQGTEQLDLLARMQFMIEKSLGTQTDKGMVAVEKRMHWSHPCKFRTP